MNLAIRQHRLTPLVTVTVAALVFAVLLIAVRLRWAPLESADYGAAASINSLVAGNATLVSVVKAVTWLGSNGVLWTVIGAATVAIVWASRVMSGAFITMPSGVIMMKLPPHMSMIDCCA